MDGRDLEESLYTEEGSTHTTVKEMDLEPGKVNTKYNPC